VSSGAGWALEISRSRQETEGRGASLHVVWAKRRKEDARDQGQAPRKPKRVLSIKVCWERKARRTGGEVENLKGV